MDYWGEGAGAMTPALLNSPRPPDLSLANLDFLMCDQVEHEVCISE